MLACPKIYDHFVPSAKIVYSQDDVLQGIKKVPSDSIQLVISSPPYNIGKSYESRTALETYLDGIEPILTELARVLSERGSLCWQVGNYVWKSEIFPLDMFYYPIFKKLGLKLRNRVIWHFDHGLHCSKRFSGRYETLLWFTKSDEYTFNLDKVRVPSKYPGKLHYKGPNRGLPSGNPLGKNPSDIWTVVEQAWETLMWNIPNVKCNHPEKTSHPCQFPIELVQRCVLAFTNQDDWVLDPFAGVGSAMIAGLMHDCRAIGFEIDETYRNEGIARIKRYYDGTLKVRPIGKPVFKPSGREKVSQVPASWGKVDNQEELFSK